MSSFCGNDLFDVLLDLFPLDGDISAAFHANHADVRADTKHLHALLAAGVLFFHFEDVPDIEFFDFHIIQILSVDVGEVNFCLKWRLVSLPLGEGGPLAVDEVNIINSIIAH